MVINLTWLTISEFLLQISYLFFTSIIQSFVYKCNNSCKLFYLDCKSMPIEESPQMPYTAFILDWQVWAQENCLFCIQQIYFMMSDGPCWETKSSIWNYFHSCHPSAFVHVSSSSCDRKRRLVRCVLMRLSPNWPNTNKTAVNRC